MEPLVQVVTFEKKRDTNKAIPVIADDRSLSAFHAAFELDLWSRPAENDARRSAPGGKHGKQAR